MQNMISPKDAKGLMAIAKQIGGTNLGSFEINTTEENFHAILLQSDEAAAKMLQPYRGRVSDTALDLLKEWLQAQQRMTIIQSVVKAISELPE